MPVIRNQFLLLLCAFFVGSLLAEQTLWGIWFTVGFAIMTYVQFSWARFFLKAQANGYSTGLMGLVLLRFLLRLLVVAAVTYVALTWGQANPISLLTGIAVGTMAPLATLAWMRRSNNRK